MRNKHVIFTTLVVLASISITYAQAVPEDDPPLASTGTGVTEEDPVDLPTDDGQGAIANTDAIDDRDWAMSIDDLTNHQAVIAYVEKDMSENGWNQAMRSENIRAYNLETLIGQNVDGYELVALFAQKSILAGTHHPTEAESRLLEWARVQYEIPVNVTDIDDRISAVVGTDNISHAEMLVDSVNNMTNHGNVSPNVRMADPDFWDLVGNTALCEYVDDCPAYMTNQKGDITFVTTYVPHWSSIRITYSPCETVNQTCSEYEVNSGTGIKHIEIPGPNHVQDWNIHVAMRGWGTTDSIIIVTSQVTDPIAGRALTAYDRDGTVEKSGNLYNPNARSESRAVITFTSYAYEL